jgi:hypothetical protein
MTENHVKKAVQSRAETEHILKAAERMAQLADEVHKPSKNISQRLSHR